MDNMCFMFGHRYCPENMFPQIVAAIREHITVHGCDRFIIGHRGEFDHLATRAVIALKSQYPFIRLIKLEPYYQPHKPYYTQEGVDDHLYPWGLEMVPKNIAIRKANEFIIDDYCSTIICFVNRSAASNTYNLLKRAEKKGNIIITNLGDFDSPL